jgi:hypothetical protein
MPGSLREAAYRTAGKGQSPEHWAREIAARTGDGNRMGTAFGHVNVAMHAISASLQLGDAKAAIETGESAGRGRSSRRCCAASTSRPPPNCAHSHDVPG